MEKKTSLIHSAFLMIAIDGDVDQSEISQLLNDPYWSKHYFEGCSEEFANLVNEGGVLELCKSSISNQVASGEEKRQFVFALLRLIMSDGKAETEELHLLHDLCESAGIDVDGVGAYIDDWVAEQKPKVTNKLILAALLMGAIDGNIDDSEIKAIFEEPYWKTLVYDGCIDEFTSLLKEKTLKEVCLEQVANNLSDESDQLIFIDEMLKLILADGEVETSEVALLGDLVKPIGISDEKLTELIKGFAQRQINARGSQAESQSTAVQTENSGCAGVIVLFILSLALVSFAFA